MGLGDRLASCDQKVNERLVSIVEQLKRRCQSLCFLTGCSRGSMRVREAHVPDPRERERESAIKNQHFHFYMGKLTEADVHRLSERDNKGR